MAHGQFDVIEAIEVVGVGRVPGFVSLLMLQGVPPFIKDRPHTRVFTEIDNCSAALAVLQVGLANQRRAPTGVAKLADKRGDVGVKGPVVKDDTMRRRHTASHDGRPVGHADRIVRISPVEDSSGLGDAIDIRRAHHRVSGESEVIRSKLIADDEQHVRAGEIRLAHDGFLGSEATRPSRPPRVC